MAKKRKNRAGIGNFSSTMQLSGIEDSQQTDEAKNQGDGSLSQDDSGGESEIDKDQNEQTQNEESENKGSPQEEQSENENENGESDNEQKEQSENQVKEDEADSQQEKQSKEEIEDDSKQEEQNQDAELPLHQQLIKEYKINTLKLPADIRESIRLFKELSKEVATSGQKGTPLDSKQPLVNINTNGLTAQELEELDEELDDPNSFTGLDRIRDGLQPKTQHFFFKTITNTFGPPIYYLGAKDGSHPVSKLLYDAVNLPLKENYDGDFVPPDVSDITGDVIDVSDYASVLKKTDERIALNILDFLRQQNDVSNYVMGEEALLYKEFYRKFRLFYNNDEEQFIRVGGRMLSIKTIDNEYENIDFFQLSILGEDDQLSYINLSVQGKQLEPIVFRHRDKEIFFQKYTIGEKGIQESKEATSELNAITNKVFADILDFKLNQSIQQLKMAIRQ